MAYPTQCPQNHQGSLIQRKKEGGSVEENKYSDLLERRIEGADGGRCVIGLMGETEFEKTLEASARKFHKYW